MEGNLRWGAAAFSHSALFSGLPFVGATIALQYCHYCVAIVAIVEVLQRIAMCAETEQKPQQSVEIRKHALSVKSK